MITPTTLLNLYQLKKLMQSLAALDAILSPDWEYRYYSFDARWSEDEQMGSIRNGAGDDVFVLFNKAGCFLKGFSHEYPNNGYTPEAFYRSVPPGFQSAVNEPAFSPHNVTFCSWRLVNDEHWQTSIQSCSLNQDAFFLLQKLDANPKLYRNFAADYFELDIGTNLIKSVFSHQHIPEELAFSINPDIDYGELRKGLTEIGYPL